MSYIGSKRSSSLVSATEITLDGAKLKSSGDSITKSDGTTAVLSESGGVVTLTADEANVGSNGLVVDSSGNLLVGTTVVGAGVGDTNTGITCSNSGFVSASRSGNAAGYFNRNTSDGTIVDFRKDGTTVGSIGTYDAGYLYIASTRTTDAGFKLGSSWILPCTTTGADRDNAIDLGKSNVRFNDVYAINYPAQTSDRNEKQDIEELTEAEQRVAVASKGLLRKYRWKSAVAKKGDDARIHFGIIAQDLQAAFEAEGLDAGRYGMFMSNTWWETSETYTDDEGIEQTRTNTYDTAEEAPEGAVERTRLGVRYSELLAFIIAAI